MKALTIKQPWAFAIRCGLKTIENRSWPTAYRGPLAIHAGKSRSYLDDTQPEDWHSLIPGLPDFALLDYGKIVAVCQLADCVPLAEVRHQPFALGPWCWLLDGIQSLTLPFPWTGAQGLFDIPDDLIKRALAEASASARQASSPPPHIQIAP